jgi:hypothetical protein
MTKILIDRETLECLTEVAEVALWDLSDGLADGTYEDADIGGYSDETIDRAISEAKEAMTNGR